MEELSSSGLRPETERLRGRSLCSRTVVVLGDSIVYGWGLLYEHSYPALVERLMNENSVRARHWRVINAGVPGNTVLMACARYQRDVAPFRPQVVVLAFGLNDAALRRTQFDVQREDLWRARHYPWLRVATILRRFINGSWLRKASLCAPAEVHRVASPRVRPRLFVTGLGDLIRRARRDGAEVHLLPLAPLSRQKMSLAQWNLYQDYNQRIRWVARRHGVSSIDLDDARSDPFAPESMLAADGVHLTASGHVWLARRVHHHLV